MYIYPKVQLNANFYEILNTGTWIMMNKKSVYHTHAQRERAADKQTDIYQKLSHWFQNNPKQVKLLKTRSLDIVFYVLEIKWNV